MSGQNLRHDKMHIQILKFIFRNSPYLSMLFLIFVSLLMLLLYAQEYLFVEPYFVLHIPTDHVPNFVLLVILSALVALVSSVITYQIRFPSSVNRNTGSSIATSFAGVGVGIGVSCGPIGISIIAALGASGVISTLSFIANYEVPIRIAAITILALTYFTMIKNIGKMMPKCQSN